MGQWANMAQTDHVTLSLCLWLMWVVIFHSYTKFEVCRPYHSKDIGHDVSITGPGDPDL